MFPHILQAQNAPPGLIYTPPQGRDPNLPFGGFGASRGCPRGLAGPDRPSGNLYQKVPHFGAGWARSGPKVPPNWPGFPDFPVFGARFPPSPTLRTPFSRFLEPTFPDFSISHLHISGFLDFPLPDFRISRFLTPRFPDFSISHLQISRFPDFCVSNFRIFQISQFLLSNFYRTYFKFHKVFLSFSINAFHFVI